MQFSFSVLASSCPRWEGVSPVSCTHLNVFCILYASPSTICIWITGAIISGEVMFQCSSLKKNTQPTSYTNEQACVADRERPNTDGQSSWFEFEELIDDRLGSMVVTCERLGTSITFLYEETRFVRICWLICLLVRLSQHRATESNISRTNYVPILLRRPLYLGVSKNNGTPKSSISIGVSIINHPLWVPLFLETSISFEGLCNSFSATVGQVSQEFVRDRFFHFEVTSPKTNGKKLLIVVSCDPSTVGNTKQW